MPIIEQAFGHYQREPIEFFAEILGWRRDWIWSGMADMAYSVRDNERTAIRAGHSVSKSYTMAGLALWFLYSFPPATVVTTAPTQNQIEAILWRELRQHHSAAKVPLFGHLTTTKLDLQPETGLKWFASGFACRPDTVTKEATAFQGLHNDNVFVIFDEAAGILPEIWKAKEHVGGNRTTRFAAVGNATSSTGEFVRCFRDPGYYCLAIPVTATPNYIEGSNRIPGVYGREYEQRIITKYGKDSDEYNVRVMGEISQKAAPGAYYAAAFKWLEANGRVRPLPHDPRYPVFTVWDPGYTTAIWFVQPSSEGLWHVIRYYEACGEDMGQYAVLLDKFSKEFGYRYGQHFAPFDIDNNQYKLVAAEGLKEVAWQAGIRFTSLEPEKSVDDGIARTQKFLSACVFDSGPACEVGIDRLKGYCQKVNKSLSNEETLVYMDHPEKNGCEHGADGFRYVSIAVRRIDTSQFQTAYGADRIIQSPRGTPAVMGRMGF
jgi:hypothetical protein